MQMLCWAASVDNFRSEHGVSSPPSPSPSLSTPVDISQMTSLSSSGYGNNMQQTVLYPLQLAWWQLNAKTNGHGIGIPSFNDIFTSQVSISSSHSRTQMAAKFFKDPCASKLVLLQLSPTSTPLSARFRKKNLSQTYTKVPSPQKSHGNGWRVRAA